MVERNGKHDTNANSISNSVLRNRCTDVQHLFPMPGPNVTFARTEPSYDLNGLFKKDGLKSMLEAKEYLAVDELSIYGALSRI